MPARKVVVVDDDAVMLATVRRVLERAGCAVATFDAPRAFLRDADLAPPCCVVLDLQMPEASGLDVQQALARRGAEAAVVFMSARGDVPSTVQAMRAGAVDFLPKPFAPQALVAAVEAGLARSAALAAASAERAVALALLATLTPREREVADLVAGGLRNAEVGKRLGSAEKTVKLHRGRVMAKLGIRSAAELVTLLGRAGQGPAAGGGR